MLPLHTSGECGAWETYSFTEQITFFGVNLFLFSTKSQYPNGWGNIIGHIWMAATNQFHLTRVWMTPEKNILTAIFVRSINLLTFECVHRKSFRGYLIAIYCYFIVRKSSISLYSLSLSVGKASLTGSINIDNIAMYDTVGRRYIGYVFTNSAQFLSQNFKCRTEWVQFR